MSRFTMRLKKYGYGQPDFEPPDDLVLTPERWSANDRGGCRECTVTAAGSAQSLVYLSGWLGDRMEIYGEAGELVWWGVLWDIEINIGNVNYTSSLEGIYNRIAVTYPFQLPDGSVESRTTDWAEDEDSINRYGTRELLYGMPESFSNSADTVRDQLLSRFKAVAPVINTQQAGQSGATLTGMGVWQKASAVYFTNEDGLVEHSGESGSFYIGRYKTSNQISFGTSTAGGLGTGSEADEMVIASGNFDPLTVDDTFTVSGSASNDGTYTVDHMDSNIQIGISGSFANEAVGATVKVSYGDGESYDNIAMSFETTNTWVCTHVALKCRQVGSPSDNFRVGLYPDSAGVPGTVLTYNETVGSALFTELTWTEFAFSSPVTLTGGTTYYLQARRTGSASLADGYEVALDEDLGYADGTAQFYNGTSWVTRSPDADMPFRIIGEISSTEQIEKAIAAVDDFYQSIIQTDSLVPVRQFSDDQRTAMETLNEMLDAGTSTGARLIAYSLPDTTIVVREETAFSYGESLAMLSADGKLKFGLGGFYPPGKLVFGEHISMEGLLLFDSMGAIAARGGGVYIQASEYDALTDTLSVESLGAPDPYRSLTTVKG